MKMDPVSEDVSLLCGLLAEKLVDKRKYLTEDERKNRQKDLRKDYGLDQGLPDVLRKVHLAVCAENLDQKTRCLSKTCLG